MWNLAFHYAVQRPRLFDTPQWFHYGFAMADYTLKNIPESLHSRLQAEAERSFRSVNQEIMFRLHRSFDADEVRLTATHARWVYDALQSGDPKPFSEDEVD